MPLPRVLQIQPYDITDTELQGAAFSDVQLAVLKNITWEAFIALTTTKRRVAKKGDILGSVQEEAYLRGRLDLGLELLGISEVDLFGVPAEASDGGIDS